MAENRPPVETAGDPHFSLETTEPVMLGHGWIAGLISALLGIFGLGVVVCIRFPSLTMPPLRSYYSLPHIRATLHLVLVASFILGTVSVCLRRNKMLGSVGILLTLVAALLGGANVPVGNLADETFLGLDWFVLNLMIYSAIYIPLERLFAKYPEQPTFRKEWHVDLVYFFVNTLLVQITSLLTVQPALVLFDWARIPAIEWTVRDWPLVVQIPLCLLAADFAQYWIHRAFHSIPVLWRFHAIHHSTEAMDWLAGSRLHLLDAIITRAVTYIPLYLLGFSQAAIIVYVFIVVVQATFIHANVRWEFSALRWLVATPCFHHWHHAAEPEAVDKNFSVHSPLWDWLFGTYYMPRRWPREYGLFGGRDVPTGWLSQLAYPFRDRMHRHVGAAREQNLTSEQHSRPEP